MIFPILRPAFFIPGLLWVPFLVCPVAYSQEPNSTHTSIAPFLDARTRCVAWLSVADFDVPETQAMIHRRDLRLTGFESLLSLLHEHRTLLMEHSVTRVYWIADSPDWNSLCDVLVLPASDSEALKSKLSEAIRTNNWSSTTRDECLLLGAQQALDRFASNDGMMSENFAKAMEVPLQSAMVMDGRLVHSLSGLTTLRRLCGNSEEALLQVAAAGVGLKSIQLDLTTFPNAMRTDFTMASAKSAQDTAELLNSIIAKGLSEKGSDPLRQNGNTNDSPPKGQTPFRIAVADSRAFVELPGAESVDSTVAAIIGNKPPFRSGEAIESLKQLCIAMHNYHDATNAFPPQSLVNKKGDRLLSWRVRLLPYFGQFNLYQQFRQDEAWDSTHNKQLIHQMPEIFRSSSLGQVAEGKTCLVLAQTENSFGGRRGGPLLVGEITDGISNTIMIVETDPSKSVVWTKPDDLEIDLENVMDSVVHESAAGFWAAMADGSVRFFKRETPADTLKALLSINGGDLVGNLP